MSARPIPVPAGYQPVKIDRRWAMLQYAINRKGEITTIAPIVDGHTQIVVTWSRRKFALQAIRDDAREKELEFLRAEVRRLRDATSAASVVAS